LRIDVIEASINQGRTAGIEGELERVLQAAEALHGPQSIVIADARTTAARLLLSLRRTAEAQQELTKALAAIEQVPGHSATHVSILNTLGHCATLESDIDAAQRYYLRAIAVLEARPDGAAPDIGRTLLNLASAEAFAGRLDDAEAHVTRARITMLENAGPGDWWEAMALDVEARIAFKRKAWSRAASLATQAASMYEREIGEEGWFAADDWLIAAEAHIADGAHAEALEILAHVDRMEASEPWLRSTAAWARATALLGLGEHDKALDAATRALRMLDDLDAERRRVQEPRIHHVLARTLLETGGDRQRAERLATRAVVGLEDVGDTEELAEARGLLSRIQALRP
jgi:tetratricopeptide (TPR) repeat protein